MTRERNIDSIRPSSRFETLPPSLTLSISSLSLRSVCVFVVILLGDRILSCTLDIFSCKRTNDEKKVAGKLNVRQDEECKVRQTYGVL